LIIRIFLIATVVASKTSRAFHDTVLGGGALPLDMLERQVKNWIEATHPGY